MLTELVTETIVEERRQAIERHLQRQAVLDYLRASGVESPSALRISAHWLGVNLERMGAALQLPDSHSAGKVA